MRIILATCLFLLATSAHAQYVGSGTTLQMPDCKPMLRKVQSIAKKIGVRPTQAGGTVVIGCDGTNYDLFELLNAFLDHMDKATKK